MNIAIIGAGFAGLVAAKTLKEFGHFVTVYEKAADVGGVWSGVGWSRFGSVWAFLAFLIRSSESLCQ